MNTSAASIPEDNAFSPGLTRRQFALFLLLLALVYVSALPLGPTEGATLAFLNRAAHFRLPHPEGFWAQLWAGLAQGIGRVGWLPVFRLLVLLGAALGAWSLFGMGRMFFKARTARLLPLIWLSSFGVLSYARDAQPVALVIPLLLFALWKWLAWQFRPGWKALVMGCTGWLLVLFVGGLVPFAAGMMIWGLQGLLGRTLTKKRLRQTLWGLLLALGAWLFRLWLLSTLGLSFQQMLSFLGFPGFMVEGSQPVLLSSTLFPYGLALLPMALPWALLFGGVVAWQVKRLMQGRQGLETLPEALSLTGWVMALLVGGMLGLSPTLTFLGALPFLVLGAGGLIERRVLAERWLFWATLSQCLLLWGLGLGLSTYSYPPPKLLLWLPVVFGLVYSAWFLFQAKGLMRWFYPALITLMSVGVLLQGHVLPHLHSYQSGKAAAPILARHHAPGQRVATFRAPRQVLSYRLGGDIRQFSSAARLKEWVGAEEKIVLLDTAERAFLEGEGFALSPYPQDKWVTLPHARLRRLRWGFFLPSTREKWVAGHTLARIRRKQAGRLMAQASVK